MHDIDRTQLESNWELEAYGNGEYEYEAEFGYEGEDGQEMFPEVFQETYDEYYQAESDGEGLFNEIDEMELAASLLEISDEDELDQFIGGLLKKAVNTVRRVVPGPVLNTLGGALRNVARKALPMAGSAVGNWIAPGAGGRIGGQLASSAGRMFGLELEGLSMEDQEFEVARRYVRLAGEAVRQAAGAPSNVPPQAVAQRALMNAAQQHAPGLIGGAGATTGATTGMRRRRRSRGTWVRRGNVIILSGV
jgi:hypothetical protein